MQPYVTTVIVDEKRRVMIDLPDDMPIGPIEIIARPIAAEAPPEPLTREWVQAKLIAGGLVDPNARYAPEDAEELSEEERERIGHALAGGKSVVELIDEDREERF